MHPAMTQTASSALAATTAFCTIQQYVRAHCSCEALLADHLLGHNQPSWHLKKVRIGTQPGCQPDAGVAI